MSLARGTRVAGADLAERIDALLPQTQCARCGYPSCRDYAEALAAGRVDLNRCPPGGRVVVERLAQILGLRPRALDAACGGERPWVVARIVEHECIGCTLCIQACPVDAIVGAGQRMHTVIEDECTGCELCLDPCPVDCIALVPMPGSEHQASAAAQPTFLERWMRERAPSARRRFENRRRRLAKTERRRSGQAALPGRDANRATKQAAIEAAVERARLRRSRRRK